MRKVLLPLTACLALCGGALLVTSAGAQQAPQTTNDARPDARHDWRMKHAERRAEMCKTLVVRKAGKLAFLETRLSLTAAQEPLFARWKAVSLDAARRHADNCANRPARNGQASMADRLTHREARLKQRLAELETERPALIALADSLTPEQSQAFRHSMKAGRHGRHHGGMNRGMRHRFGHHGDRPEASPL